MLKKIKFPQDEKPHKNIIEWWYFNGNLEDKKGNKYSYMNTLFKADADKINFPFSNLIPIKYFYFSHHLLCDIKKKKTYSEIHPILVITKQKKSKFFNITYDTLIPDNDEFEIKQLNMKKYSIKTDMFNLKLISKKKPLLEGGSGFLRLHSKSTYYYSLTDINTKGTIKIGRKTIEVKGKSWMDHQWADVPYNKNTNKWNWFSIKLNNKTDIIILEFYDGKNKDYLASIIDSNNQSFHTKKIKLKNLKKFWTSKKTGASYPLYWEVQIPKIKAKLKISPLLKKQEMVNGIINYWEGPTTISGTLGNKKIKGEGFMELVGYPMKKSLLKQYEEKAEDYLKENINNLQKAVKKILK